jgi:hypothetical protein
MCSSGVACATPQGQREWAAPVGGVQSAVHGPVEFQGMCVRLGGGRGGVGGTTDSDSLTSPHFDDRPVLSSPAPSPPPLALGHAGSCASR